MNGILYRDLNWGMMMIGFFVCFVTTVDPLICVVSHHSGSHHLCALSLQWDISSFVWFLTKVDPLICVFCHLVLVIKTLNPDQKPL